MRYQLTYAALLALAAAHEPSTWTSTAPTTTPGVTCAPGLVEGVTGCVLPPTPPPKPLFPWPFKDKCLEKCVNLGSWTDAHLLCAPGSYVSLYQCRDKECPHDKKDFPEEYHEICSAKTTTTTPEPTPTCTINYRGYCNCPPGWIQDKNMGCVRPTSSSSSTTPEPTPTCTLNYRGHCICPPGWIRDSTGACVKPTTSPSSSTTPTPTPTTTITPPYPCHGPNCTPLPPRPTIYTITTTTTSIETLTYCPHKHTCHGQTTTWTKTEGPTSCPPTVTCTCVLPGYPTLTTCPRSVTCTGQTTTITEGSTVVLPIETLPPHTPAGPTTSTVVEFPGAAATRGVGLLAVVAGVVAAL